jgi:hypothetical protein
MQHSTHVSVHARPDDKIAAERPRRHGQFWEPEPTSPQRQIVKHATARKRRQHDRRAADDID